VIVLNDHDSVTVCIPLKLRVCDPSATSWCGDLLIVARASTLIGVRIDYPISCEPLALGNYLCKILFESGCRDALQEFSGAFRRCAIMGGGFLCA
jgi:hypothetical protein